MGQIIAAGINAYASAYAADKSYQASKDTNMTNYKITQDVNQANKELAENQNQWNIDQWNRENEYNKPVNQASRLMDAGLSGAAAAQAVDGGNASQLTSANLANATTGNPMVAPKLEPWQIDPSAFDSITKTIREILAIKKDSNEVEKSDAEAKVWNDMVLTDLDIKNADLSLKKQQYSNMAKSFPYTLRSLRYKASADKFLPEMNKVDLQLHKANVEQAEENVKLARQQFNFLDKMNDESIQKVVAEIKNLEEVRKNLAKQGKLTDAQKSNVDVDSENKRKEGKILNEKVYEERIEAIWKEAGAPEDVASRLAALEAKGIIPSSYLDSMLLGVRSYIRKGRSTFGLDPATRDFLYYYWDKGSANRMGLGLHTVGGGISTLFGPLGGGSGGYSPRSEKFTPY